MKIVGAPLLLPGASLARGRPIHLKPNSQLSTFNLLRFFTSRTRSRSLTLLGSVAGGNIVLAVSSYGNSLRKGRGGNMSPSTTSCGILVRPMDISVWTSHFDSAAFLWETLANAEGISRDDPPISASAARKFADDLLLLTSSTEAREQMRRDPQGARSFASFLHLASNQIHEGELPLPPKIEHEHMPFYLPTFAVKEAIRYWVNRARHREYHPEPPPLDS